MLFPIASDALDFVRKYRIPFDLVIADPPWSYSDRGRHDVYGITPYERVSLQYLAHLFSLVETRFLLLWITNSFIPMLDYLFRDTDLVYKTLITWVKKTKHGKDFYGLGNWFRNSTEHIAVFAHKKERPLRSNMRTVVYYPSYPRTMKPRELEVLLIKEFLPEGGKVLYLFSGTYISPFESNNYDIYCVDLRLLDELK